MKSCKWEGWKRLKRWKHMKSCRVRGLEKVRMVMKFEKLSGNVAGWSHLFTHALLAPSTLGDWRTDWWAALRTLFILAWSHLRSLSPFRFCSSSVVAVARRGRAGAGVWAFVACRSVVEPGLAWRIILAHVSSRCTTGMRTAVLLPT